MSAVYHDFNQMKDVALHYAKMEKRNYNVIIMNPDEKGNYNESKGSTYEFVTDSYFDKPRPNAVKVFETDEVLNPEKYAQKQEKLNKEKVTDK